MATVNDCYKILKQLNKQFDSIEELLKIVAVNDLINDIDITDNYCNVDSSVNDALERERVDSGINDVFEREKVSNSVSDIIERYKFVIAKVDKMSEKWIIYLEPNNAWHLTDLSEIQYKIFAKRPDYIPVFQFEKMPLKQRKSLEQVKLSYCIKNKELHIFITDDYKPRESKPRESGGFEIEEIQKAINEAVWDVFYEHFQPE